ncbi:hypothetical protein JHK87_038142 [Glycine soja]|nr:hypothetical protein JHK87_038142 [Glycine soja]
MEGHFLFLMFHLSLTLPIIVRAQNQSGSVVSFHYPESYHTIYCSLNLSSSTFYRLH